VEAFLDTPVKRYSSGMYMRLAFAVAAHLEPDVLIVDEVLAVGDMAFQKKCLGRMNAIAGEGRTVLFVSHNMTAVQGLCTRVALLEHGRVAYDGTPREAISRYLASATTAETVPLADRTDRTGDGSTRFTSVRVESADPDGVIRSTSRLKLTIGYRGERSIQNPRFVATIRDANTTGLFALDSGATGGLPDELPAEGVVECVTDPINLTPGRCYLTLRLQRGTVDTDWVRPAAEFDVESDDFFGTGRQPTRDWVVGLLRHRWSTVDTP
jgi:lipopolysaccharide transport system ATP-binding protein